MRSTFKVWVGLGLLLLLPAMIAIGWNLTNGLTDPTQTGQRVAPVVVEVSTVVHQPRIAVIYQTKEVPGELVRAASSGLLTWIIAEGTTLRSGEVVATVGNTELIGYEAPAPFWRDLSSGDSGADVAQLQELLANWGYFSGEADGKFGAATAASVRAFNIEHYAGNKSNLFSHSYLVWLGQEPFEVTNVLKVAGEQVITGDGLFQTHPTTAAIEVEESRDAAAVLSGQSTVLLQVEDSQVPYILGTGLVSDPAAIEALLPEINATGEGTGYLLGGEELELQSVPGSALVTDDAGLRCVVDGETNRPVVVEPVGGGLSSVTFEPVAGLTSVLANPHQVLVDIICS